MLQMYNVGSITNRIESIQFPEVLHLFQDQYKLNWFQDIGYFGILQLRRKGEDLQGKGGGASKGPGVC